MHNLLRRDILFERQISTITISNCHSESLRFAQSGLAIDGAKLVRIGANPGAGRDALDLGLERRNLGGLVRHVLLQLRQVVRHVVDDGNLRRDPSL